MPITAKETDTAGMAIGSEMPRTAMLVDWDNFSTRCAAQGVAVRPDELKRLGRAAGGKLVWSAVFVDSATLAAGERVKMFTCGFTIHDCPKMKVGSSGHLKDTVDPAMIEQMNAIAAFLPVDRVILCSEDRDYIRIIETLRDAGKRVSVVVPTLQDRPELARHADDTLVYAEFAGVQNDIFAKVARRFVTGRFGSPDHDCDDECASFIKRLSTIVSVLDEDLEVNVMRFGFLALLRKTKHALSHRGHIVAESEIKRLLEFLIAQDVLTTRSSAAKKSKRTKGADRANAPIHYRLMKTHPFIVWTECALHGPVGTQNEGSSMPGTAIDENHPRVRRFRERYGAGASSEQRPVVTGDVSVSEPSATSRPTVERRDTSREATPQRPSKFSVVSR